MAITPSTTQIYQSRCIISSYKWDSGRSHEVLALLNFLLWLFDQNFLLLGFLLDDGARHDGPSLAFLPLRRALRLLLERLLLLLLLVFLLFVLSLLSYASLLLLLHDGRCFLLAQLQSQQLIFDLLFNVLEQV